MYGAEIIERLKSGNLIVAEGTIYPLLSRLKTDGLITYYWIESDSGHPRKYFRLTPEGQNVLILMEKSWLELKHAISTILQK